MFWYDVISVYILKSQVNAVVAKALAALFLYEIRLLFKEAVFSKVTQNNN